MTCTPFPVHDGARAPARQPVHLDVAGAVEQAVGFVRHDRANDIPVALADDDAAAAALDDVAISVDVAVDIDVDVDIDVAPLLALAAARGRRPRRFAFPCRGALAPGLVAQLADAVRLGLVALRLELPIDRAVDVRRGRSLRPGSRPLAVLAGPPLGRLALLPLTLLLLQLPLPLPCPLERLVAVAALAGAVLRLGRLLVLAGRLLGPVARPLLLLLGRLLLLLRRLLATGLAAPAAGGCSCCCAAVRDAAAAAPAAGGCSAVLALPARLLLLLAGCSCCCWRCRRGCSCCWAGCSCCCWRCRRGCSCCWAGCSCCCWRWRRGCSCCWAGCSLLLLALPARLLLLLRRLFLLLLLGARWPLPLPLLAVLAFRAFLVLCDHAVPSAPDPAQRTKRASQTEARLPPATKIESSLGVPC